LTEQGDSLDADEMRLFFESKELCDTSERITAYDALNEPVTITVEHALSDFLPTKILHPEQERDVSKAATDNSYEIWLYQKQHVDPFDRFMAFMAERISDAFNLFLEIDADGGGSLDESELRDAVKKLNFPATEEEFQYIWESLDADGSGELDYTELVRAVKEHVPRNYLA